MKRIFLLVALVANISLVTATASNMHGRGKGKKYDYSMLNLSENQKTEIGNINNEFGKKLEQIKNDSTLSKTEAVTKRKELRVEKDNKINNILSAEQQSLLKEQREKKQRNVSSSKNSRGRKRNVNKVGLYEKLNLSQEQRESLNKLNDDYGKQMKALRVEHDSAISNILNAEQKDILKAEMSKKRPDQVNNKGPRHGKKKGHEKLDAATIEKLSALKENYKKEKRTIEMSRIAPEFQKQKIDELKTRYKNERQNILKEAQVNSPKEKQNV